MMIDDRSVDVARSEMSPRFMHENPHVWTIFPDFRRKLFIPVAQVASPVPQPGAVRWTSGKHRKKYRNGPLIVDLSWFTYENHENRDVPVGKLLVYQRFIATKKLVKSDLKIWGSTQKMSRQTRFGNPKLRVLDENSRNQFRDAREE